MSEWMTEDEAAEWFAVPVGIVRDAVKSGALPALRLGEHVRISRTAAIAAGGHGTPGELTTEATDAEAASSRPIDGLPEPAGFSWVEPLVTAERFEHWWPRKRTADNPATSSEEIYPIAWVGATNLLGHEISVRVGQSLPRSDGRPRLTVFFDEYPEAEFAQSATRDGWASAIKVNGKATLRSGQSVPELYRRSKLLPYQEATGFSGPGRTKGLALVIGSDDIVSAVHHAAARWLGKRGHRLEPAA